MNFPTPEEWLREHNEEVERKWHWICDEYGDAAPLLSQYKMQCYNEAMLAAMQEVK